VVLQSPKIPKFVPDHTQLERLRHRLQGDGGLCRNAQAGDKSDGTSATGITYKSVLWCAGHCSAMSVTKLDNQCGEFAEI
jgi:hypothetical protein